MVKMLVSARKRADFTDRAFSERWHGHHAEIVRAHGEALGFRRYIQSHRVEASGIPALEAESGSTPPKNGQAELWWESIEAMLLASASAEGAAASVLFEEDEKRFNDVPNLSAFLAEEYVLFDHAPGSKYSCPSGGAKLVVELWSDTAKSDLRDWTASHAEHLMRSPIAAAAQRYIVNVPIADDRFDFAIARGWRPAPDGSIELWFKTHDDLLATMAGETLDGWKGDLARFADTGRLCPLIAHPRLIMDLNSRQE